MHLKTLEPIHAYIPKPLDDACKILGGCTMGLGFRVWGFKTHLNSEAPNETDFNVYHSTDTARRTRHVFTRLGCRFQNLGSGVLGILLLPCMKVIKVRSYSDVYMTPHILDPEP